MKKVKKAISKAVLLYTYLCNYVKLVKHLFKYESIQCSLSALIMTNQPSRVAKSCKLVIFYTLKKHINLKTLNQECFKLFML